MSVRTHSWGTTPKSALRDAFAAACPEGFYLAELNVTDAATIADADPDFAAELFGAGFFSDEQKWCVRMNVDQFIALNVALLAQTLIDLDNTGCLGPAAYLRGDLLTTLDLEEI